MRYLTAELNRTILSRNFAASVIGTVFVLCIGAYGSFQLLFKPGEAMASGMHTAALLQALTSDTMLMALPVLAALPGTAGFVEDLKSGYIKFSLPREGKPAYIRAKAGAVALSGAAALAVGIAIAAALFALAFLPFEAPAQPGAQSMAMDALGKATLFALCAALWSLVGLALSTATMSTHMAYASPFILYYVLVILVSQYFPKANLLSPQEWLKPTREWPGGGWGIALLMAELIAASALGFNAAALRRLRNE